MEPGNVQYNYKCAAGHRSGRGPGTAEVNGAGPSAMVVESDSVGPSPMVTEVGRYAQSCRRMDS